MKHYYFLIGTRNEIDGMCSLLAVNSQSARWKVEEHVIKAFGLKTMPFPTIEELSHDDFKELAIEYKNKSVAGSINLIIA